MKLFRQAVRAQHLYDEFLFSKKEHAFLTRQESYEIENQLKRSMCYQKSYFIQDINSVPIECKDYELGYVNINYTDKIPCIGNWPGFLMTKMPYWERES